MRSILSLLFLIICHAASSQSGGNPSSTNTFIISSLQKPVIAGNKYYRQIVANTSNATAWLNYYKWTIHSKELEPSEKKQEQAQSITSAKQYIAGSWQFSLMNFLHSRKRDKIFLEEALKNTTDKAAVYPYAIQFAVITQNEALLAEYASALNASGPLSPALYEYHYNALMSVPGNAIVYAKGISDLVPMVVLQQVYGIRKDIRFRYYEEKITDTANAYVCLSAGKEIIQSYPDAGYSGLMIKLSVKLTCKELQQQIASFRFSTLNNLRGLDHDEQFIYENYLPSLILLYRSYKESRASETAECKLLVEKIAFLTDNVQQVNKILGN